jgi:uncharacterized protein (DUF58 family)
LADLMGSAPRAADLNEASGRWRGEAASLAARLPSLIVAARNVAQSVMHGVHGRRRAGPGENFWQFRPFISGEPTAGVDWRRSAREDRAYVREREWEAAHTVWIWMDRSASMRFASPLAQTPKVDRAIVLGLAAADLLVRGGERVGLLGLTRPLATRGVVDRFAEALALEERIGPPPQPLPDAQPLKAHAKALLFGDFLAEAEDVRRLVNALSADGAEGHLLMIADPIEETFPFRGHTEFLGPDERVRLRAPRAQALREDYLKRLREHREAVREGCASRGWTVAIHRTDRSAADALLALRMRLEAPARLSARSA